MLKTKSIEDLRSKSKGFVQNEVIENNTIMAIGSNRSEWGSDFHFMENVFKSSATTPIQNLIPNSLFYFSGRSALFSLLQFGINKYRWTRVLLPDYYCHDVDNFLKELPVEI